VSAETTAADPVDTHEPSETHEGVLPGEPVIVAWVRPTDLAPDERARAREIADRKTMRLLDGASTPPFLAIHEAFLRAPACPPEDVAIYTVSRWDPMVPEVPFAFDGSAGGLERLSRHFYEPANPSDWLRRMPNGPICQAAIVAGFRGPNLHLVGDVEALSMAVQLATLTIVKDEAPLAVVVAYDEAPGNHHMTPDSAHTRAAAVVLGRIDPDRDTSATALISAAALWGHVDGHTQGTSALDALVAGLDELTPDFPDDSPSLLRTERTWPWNLASHS
jgi:hypothetical protein